MSLHQISKKTIEVFYFNQKQCDDYNGYHGLREGIDIILRPGYYFDAFNGPYTTEKAAIAAAHQFYS